MAKTLQEQYVAGLETLGYEIDRKNRSHIYLSYKRPGSELRYLVGKGGALRMTSTTIERSRPCGPNTKNHIITAPQRRPAVFLACQALATFTSWPDEIAMTKELQERDAGMAALPATSLLAHVKAWLDYEQAKAAAKRPAGADNPSDRGGAAPQLPQGSSERAGGGNLVQGFQDDPRADVRRFSR